MRPGCGPSALAGAREKLSGSRDGPAVAGRLRPGREGVLTGTWDMHAPALAVLR